jgi:hypothetical protein
VHFVLLGVMLFAASLYQKSARDASRIIITAEQIVRLATGYARQFGSPPSAAELNQLVENYINEEVLYRAGIELGLERDDEIVRRRIVQKMQFLQQDFQVPAEPTDSQLEDFYKTNGSRYVTPSSVTFSHIFFSPDRGGDEAARSRAAVCLERLNDRTTRAPERGDDFPGLNDYADFSQVQAMRVFGDTELAHDLLEAPVGHWSGPYRSGYGWHLIYILAKQPSRLPTLSEIRDRLRTDQMVASQEEANQKALAALRARFTIVREDPSAACEHSEICR